MKAYLNQNLKGGFLLSEENLIKLNDIISKRLKEKRLESELLYKVYRIDSLVYETTEYQKIVDEENSKRNLLIRVELTHESENLSFKLVFDKAENSNIEIEGEEKDFTYLLFSDIKKYLTTEIIKFRSFKFKNIKIEMFLMPVIMMLFLIFTLTLVAKPPVGDAEFKEILNSDSIQVKLNYMLTAGRNKIDLDKFWYMLIATTIIAIFLSLLTRILDKVYPTNIFYVGKEIIKYDKHCANRSKVIWGIFIALAISIIAGFLVFFLTR